MSAFMVSKDHIDAIVTTAMHGPKDGHSRWEHGCVKWAAHDPRETHWQEQEWRSLAIGGMALLVSKAGEMTATQVGEMLWTENERSVEARYPSDHAEMLSVDYCLGYEYAKTPRALTIAEAFSAIACLEYQSCEHDGWVDSEACRFLFSLRDSLVNALPGYAAAQWEVNFDRAPTSA